MLELQNEQIKKRMIFQNPCWAEGCVEKRFRDLVGCTQSSGIPVMVSAIKWNNRVAQKGLYEVRGLKHCSTHAVGAEQDYEDFLMKKMSDMLEAIEKDKDLGSMIFEPVIKHDHEDQS